MAAVVTAETVPATASPSWAQKYPPLLALAVALLIAVVVLPSSLNLPQTPPTQTLEYAPVPPSDDTQTPPAGNFSSLGLGTSSGVEGVGAPGGNGDGLGAAPGTPPAKGTAFKPSGLRCVGNPPRQTEDPLAPPCVAVYQGDNGGSTYAGVTKDEVRILAYVDGGINYISGSDPSNTVAPTDKLYDLFQPCPDGDAGCDHLITKGFRGWQRYFNDRFQTYGRKVHLFVFFSNQVNANTPEHRQADAADIYQRVKPFAVVSFATEPYEDVFLEAMTDKQVLNFGSFGGRKQSFFQAHPRLIWGYQPSIEQQADQFSTYVCTKVANKPVVLSGNPGDNGKPRVYGLISAGPVQGQKGLEDLTEAVVEKVKQCGVTFAAKASSPDKDGCLAQNNGQSPDYAGTAMADFQTKHVTTIIWTGCIDGNWGKSAETIRYSPEWILNGDGILEANNPERLAQNTNTFNHHAVVVTPQTFLPALQQQICYKAYREADQDLPDTDLGYVCDYYKNLFQLVLGIQVAGPRLGPTSIDQGFRAIPAHPSSDPQTPACYYPAGDYTCVKDAEAEYWDSSGQAPGDNRPGCWRSIQNGLRYLPGKWPDGNIDAQIKGNEPCNGYSTSVRFNLA